MSSIINADTSDGLKFTSDTSGEIKLQSAGTDTVTVDTSGNVGIGTSSPDSFSKLHVYDTDGDTRIRLEDTTGLTSLDMVCADGSVNVINFGDASDINVGRIDYDHSSNEMAFKTNDITRLTIDAGGGLHVGRNTGNDFTDGDYGFSTTASGTISFASNTRSLDIYRLGTGYIQQFRDSSTGTIHGGIFKNASSVSFQTTSDYRLKENNVNITDGISRVKLLKPYRFNFIAEPDVIVDGFFAHEVQNVVPEAINGEKDAIDDEGNPDYQGIDQSKLVPLLTAALQEAITKIEDLETRIQALENA